MSHTAFYHRFLTLTSHWKGDVLAFFTGLSLPFAFAPFSLFPIAILSPALLFLLWQNISLKRVFWRGWLYGVGLFGMGVSWISISFYQFGGMPFIGAMALTTAFIFFIALYPALMGWLIHRFFPISHPLTLLIIFPAIWTIMEWIRGWFLTGFPWLSLGYSQIDSVLSHFAPLLGVFGVSWLVVLSASLLIYSVQKKSLFSVLSLCFIWGMGWLLGGIHWTEKQEKSLDVVLVQANIPQEYKFESDFLEESLQRYLTHSQQHRDVDLIVWPETAIPIFYSDPPALRTLVKLVQEYEQYGVSFLVGVPKLAKDRINYFNTVTTIGQYHDFYYKYHLVPFGEYIPFFSYIGDLFQFLDVPLSQFSAGNFEQPPLRIAGENVGISICYEDAFAEQVRINAPDTTLLVNVSNDAWFGDSVAPHQHLEIARMRALETGRYLLRATNTGISAIINEKGKIIVQSPQFKIHSLRGTIFPYQGTTFYVQLGNKLIITILFTLILTSYFIIHHVKK